MKKFILAATAIAAMSTAGFASQRGYDLRDSEYWTANGVSSAAGASSGSTTSSAALAVDHGISKGTNFERTRELSVENLQGRY